MLACFFLWLTTKDCCIHILLSIKIFILNQELVKFQSYLFIVWFLMCYIVKFIFYFIFSPKAGVLTHWLCAVIVLWSGRDWWTEPCTSGIEQVSFPFFNLLLWSIHNIHTPFIYFFPLCNIALTLFMMISFWCRRIAQKLERLHLLACIFLVSQFTGWIKQPPRWVDCVVNKF